MSDSFWLAMSIIVPSVTSGLVGLLLAIVANRTKNAVEKSGASATKAADSASKKADEVKAQLDVTGTDTERKLEDLAKVANDTHILVNSNMEKALQIAAVALRRVADMTKNEGDLKAAELAEKALADHIAKQVKVDKLAANVAVASATAAAVDAQKTIGEMARETMGDVKVVKQDVKDIKDAT